MFSDRIAPLLRDERKRLDMSRQELARRAGVSVRLVAEFERGQRPNVSLETALVLLNAVGIARAPRSPNSPVGQTGDSAPSNDSARAARAARRRKTWKGRHTALHDAGSDPLPGRTIASRIATVSRVSVQTHALATAGRIAADRFDRTSRGGSRSVKNVKTRVGTK